MENFSSPGQVNKKKKKEKNITFHMLEWFKAMY